MRSTIQSSPPAVVCSACGAHPLAVGIINPFRGNTVMCEPCFDAEYGPDEDCEVQQ